MRQCLGPGIWETDVVFERWGGSGEGKRMYGCARRGVGMAGDGGWWGSPDGPRSTFRGSSAASDGTDSDSLARNRPAAPTAGTLQARKGVVLGHPSRRQQRASAGLPIESHRWRGEGGYFPGGVCVFPDRTSHHMLCRIMAIMLSTAKVETPAVPIA